MASSSSEADSALPAWLQKLAPTSRKWFLGEVPGVGRGVIAAEDLAAGEVLVRTPASACWKSADGARALLAERGFDVEQMVEDGLSDEGAVALWVIYELQKGEASEFAGSIGILPKEFNTILQWSEDEVAWLSGSAFHSIAEGLREETDTEWELISALPLSPPGAAPELTKELFCWAKSGLLSRHLEMDWEGLLPEGSKVIVPGFDLFNHEALEKPNCVFEVLQEGEPPVPTAVVVRTDKAVRKGEELRITYGPVPNASLLISAGFIVEGNPNDTAEFVLCFAVPPSRRPWLRGIEERAAELRREHGLVMLPFEVVGDPGDRAEASAEFVMRHNLVAKLCLPSTLLATVRLQVLSEADLTAATSAAETPDGGLCAPPGSLKVGGDAAERRLASILESLLSAYAPLDPGGCQATSEESRRRWQLVRTVTAEEQALLRSALQTLRST